MRPQVQLLIGVALFVANAASAQGLIEDKNVERWVILIASAISLGMQKMGLNTEPDRKPASQETIADKVEEKLKP